jgi:F0F1-type ATP synthase epsilon subunit
MENTFQCIVVAPPGKILDCRASSIVFPAHDGMVGVLYDHMPMFCELGLGLMEVEYVTEEADKPQNNKAIVLIDSGFALIGQNLATLVSNEAYSSTDIKKEKIDRIIDHINRKISAGAFTPLQQEHETQKIALLKTLLESAETNQPESVGKSPA